MKNYSSGMYVRLGFAVAINVDPDILLVDEVLAVGDAAFQEKCMDKFSEFRRQGKTVVIVSHAMGSLRSMCDHAVWLEHGRVIRQGQGHRDRRRLHRRIAPLPGRHRGGHRDRHRRTPRDHGSGEVLIMSVDMLDDEPVAATVSAPATGSPCVSYEASEHVPDAVFGLALENLDGVYVWAHNTEDAGNDIRRSPGPARSSWSSRRCPCSPGRSS